MTPATDGGSVAVPRSLIFDPDLSDPAFRLALYLACSPGDGQLIDAAAAEHAAAALRWQLRQVTDAIGELCRARLIRAGQLNLSRGAR